MLTVMVLARDIVVFDNQYNKLQAWCLVGWSEVYVLVQGHISCI